VIEGLRGRGFARKGDELRRGIHLLSQRPAYRRQACPRQAGFTHLQLAVKENGGVNPPLQKTA
jgi:hypothetical protein